MKRYDVYRCYVNGRTSNRAVEWTGDEPPPRPDSATEHVDEVYATNGRQAIHLALKRNGLLRR